MPKSTVLANGVLDLVLRNANLANVGDATGLRGSTTAGSLYVALHTADPGVGGNQSTSEISYTGYARVALARATTWTAASGGISNPAAAIDFGAMTAGAGGTVTYASFGAHPTTGASGAGPHLYSGVVSPSIVVSNGVQPRLTTASSITET